MPSQISVVRNVQSCSMQFQSASKCIINHKRWKVNCVNWNQCSMFITVINEQFFLSLTKTAVNKFHIIRRWKYCLQPIYIRKKSSSFDTFIFFLGFFNKNAYNKKNHKKNKNPFLFNGALRAHFVAVITVLWTKLVPNGFTFSLLCLLLT